MFGWRCMHFCVSELFLPLDSQNTSGLTSRVLGYFPRLLFVLPHVALISIILATYPYPSSAAMADGLPPAQAAEGSVPWQANMQGIQNLMGFVYVLTAFGSISHTHFHISARTPIVLFCLIRITFPSHQSPLHPWPSLRSGPPTPHTSSPCSY